MNPLIREAIELQRSGDAWGDTMEPLFGLAQTIYALGFEVPAELEFRPAPGLDLQRLRNEGDENCFANEMLDMIDANLVSVGELQYAARVLNRTADILRAQGRDY